mmetsp:Transcript_101516/g.263036  ORF Transcript_101516/g.263036 Transcript_101516/m.263036 type:complete len:181 (-) Transcript_101516:207-749(-)
MIEGIAVGSANPCRQLDSIRESVPVDPLLPRKRAATSCILRSGAGWWPPPTPNGRPRPSDGLGSTWAGGACGMSLRGDDDTVSVRSTGSSRSGSQRSGSRPVPPPLIAAVPAPPPGGQSVSPQHAAGKMLRSASAPALALQRPQYATRTSPGYFGHSSEPGAASTVLAAPARCRPYRRSP